MDMVPKKKKKIVFKKSFKAQLQPNKNQETPLQVATDAKKLAPHCMELRADCVRTTTEKNSITHYGAHGV